MAKVIAEIGINHNGDLHTAKSMIAMAKEAGADAVKFQVRDVGTVYNGQLNNPRNDGNPYGWKTVGEQKRGIEFSLEQYKQIDYFCGLMHMPWFSSFWDMKSARSHVLNFNYPYHKIASAMITHDELCEFIAEEGKFTFISTGGSTFQQIDNCVSKFRSAGTQFCIMHCVSQYPCPEHSLNLNLLYRLRERYPDATLGYSGHEVGLHPSVMALAMGAKWVERHITLDRSMYGSDQSASMEFHGLQQLCRISHKSSVILGDGAKIVLDKEMECMRKLRYWES